MKIEMTKIRSLLLMAVMLVAGTAVSFGTEPESVKKKVISKSFEVSGGEMLKTDNRYGNTTVTYWAMNEVSVRVEIEAKTVSNAAAQEMIDRVQIELSKDGNTIYATTSFKDKSRSIGFKGNFSINYYINMPQAMDMALAQKYGNIIMPEKNEGKCSVEVKYGNLRAGSFTQPLELSAKYGNVDTGDLTEAEMDLGYCGSVRIGNARKIEIDSKYSNLKIGGCDKISLENKYGNVSIGSIREGEIDTKYGDVTIKAVEQSLVVDEMAYCNLEIEKLAADFKTLDVDARYGNLDVRIAPETAFEVIAENMKYGKTELKGFNITQVTSQNKSDSRYEINGGGKSSIRFDGGNYSNLRVKAL